LHQGGQVAESLEELRQEFQAEVLLIVNAKGTGKTTVGKLDGLAAGVNSARPSAP
jgi:predicted ATPase